MSTDFEPTASRPLHLSVNIDHIATLRQARGTSYPDPVDAAALAEAAGAGGITVHLRVDRRHIQDGDVHRLRRTVRGKLNLEISLAEEMLTLATAVKPNQVTLVPELPDELTTEGGLDLLAHLDAVAAAAERLTQVGIEPSLFLDPELVQINALGKIGSNLVPGFEINTDAYTRADGKEAEMELRKVREASRLGAELGFKVYAGHGLTTENVVGVASVPEIEELNIGHWLVSRASLIGLADAVREMLSAIKAGRSKV
jgi:pyridoxine 5-phosphate synthase